MKLCQKLKRKNVKLHPTKHRPTRQKNRSRNFSFVKITLNKMKTSLEARKAGQRVLHKISKVNNGQVRLSSLRNKQANKIK